jgi:hypothetical protein
METVIARYKKFLEPGVVVHALNPSTQDAEVGGLWVWSQPELYSKTLSQKKKKKVKFLD